MTSPPVSRPVAGITGITGITRHVLPSEPVTGPAARPLGARTWGLWLVTALGFPIGGLPAIALGGVDDVTSALLGGAAAGFVIGGGQCLVLRRLAGTPWAWVPATAAGLAVGLAVGSSLVGYRTGAADLVVQGALSGAGVGLAQALAMRGGVGVARGLAWG